MHAIDALRADREQGVFPVNPKLDSRRAPIWIDDQGTSCAMAQLVLSSFARELADAVAARENTAHLPDMRTEGLVDDGMIEEPRGESAGRGCSTARGRWPVLLVSNLVLAARNWRRR